MIKLIISFLILLLANSAFSDDASRYEFTNAAIQYPFDLPKIKMTSDKDSGLSDLVQESKNLVFVTGKVIACSEEPIKFLNAYSSPTDKFYARSIFTYNSTHEKGSCYKIMDTVATKNNKNSYVVTYYFTSPTSGESVNRKVGLIKVSDNWYLTSKI